MPTRYWVGNGGSWSAGGTIHWSATSGGSSGASAPTLSDDVIFDANSFTLDGQTVAVTATTISCYSITWAGVTHNPTWDPNDKDVRIYGTALTLSPNMTLSPTFSSFYFWTQALTTCLVTTAGQVLPAIRFQPFAASAVLSLQDDVVLNRDAAEPGAFDASTSGSATVLTNGHDIDCGTFTLDAQLTTNLSTSTITVREGEIDLDFSFDQVDRLSADQATFIMVDSDAFFFANILQSVGTLICSGTVAFRAYGYTIDNLVLNPGHYTLDGTATRKWLTVGDLTMDGTSIAPVHFNSDLVTNILTITGTVTADYAILTGLITVGGPFSAGRHSVDKGGNTGWTFPNTATTFTKPAKQKTSFNRIIR